MGFATTGANQTCCFAQRRVGLTCLSSHQCCWWLKRQEHHTCITIVIGNLLLETKHGCHCLTRMMQASWISSLIFPHQRSHHCFLRTYNVSDKLQRSVEPEGEHSTTSVQARLCTSMLVHFYRHDRRQEIILAAYALSFKVVSELAPSPRAVTWDPGTDVYVEPSWCGTVTGWNILSKHVFENQRPGSGLLQPPFLLLTSAPERQIGTLCSCDSVFMSFKQASALSRKVREASARSAAQVFQKLAVVEAEGEPGEPFFFGIFKLAVL